MPNAPGKIGVSTTEPTKGVPPDWNCPAYPIISTPKKWLRPYTNHGWLSVHYTTLICDTFFSPFPLERGNAEGKGVREMPTGRGVLMRVAISRQSKQSPSNKAFRKYWVAFCRKCPAIHLSQRIASQQMTAMRWNANALPLHLRHVR